MLLGAPSWLGSSFQSNDDDELKNNMEQLLDASRADSTVRQYKNDWAKWERWASTKQLSSLPADSENVALYLTEIYQHSQSAAAAERVASAIKWFHIKANIRESPISPMVKLVIDGMKRKEPKHATGKKSPLTKEILHKLFDKFIDYAKEDVNLVEWRTIWRVAMEYKFCARWSDIAALTPANIHISDSHMKVIFRKSKTDQYWDGDEAWASRKPENKYCIVRFTEEYIRKLGYNHNEESLLQCQLRAAKPVARERVLEPIPNKRVSYSTCLANFRQLLTSIGIENPKSYGEHSGKHGSASDAVEAGCSQFDIQTHGRWKSRATARKYQKLNREMKSKVPDAIGM